jgi:hypothetical protein
VTRLPHQGPLAFASEILQQRPDLETVRSLLQRYSELRYGRPEPGAPAQVRDFERAVSRLTVTARA